MRFDVLTIFPDALGSYLNTSILKRAQAKEKIRVVFHDVRAAATDRHRTTDDSPYGGGAGMVMKAEPILKTVDRLSTSRPAKRKIILFSAKGQPFNQKLASQWASSVDQLVLICGRYEGIDERVQIALKAEEVSIGPYVTTDGEVAAMVIISTVARLLPGVIRLDSLAEESFWNHLLKKEVSSGQLEYPHYTRPAVFTWRGKKYRVPKALLSGDHKMIQAWRGKHRRT